MINQPYFMQYKEYPVWKFISNFPFDAPNAIETFPDRLARSGEWSTEHCHTVIEEYKKFLFLCATKEYQMVPPRSVDLAWSLHMEYYPTSWKSLQKFIPAKHIARSKIFNRSEPDDEELFFNHYLATKDCYIEIFGERPPVTVWGMYDEEFEKKTSIIVGKDKPFTMDMRFAALLLVFTGSVITYFLNNPIPGILGIIGLIVFVLTSESLNLKFSKELEGKGFRGYISFNDH